MMVVMSPQCVRDTPVGTVRWSARAHGPPIAFHCPRHYGATVRDGHDDDAVIVVDDLRVDRGGR